MTRLNPVYAAMGTTIFEAMSALCRETGAINLGQGFPDDNGPPELIAAAARALSERSNQYPPSAGLPELRDAICAFYARRQGLALARENVIVTSGATEAIAAAVLAFVSPGDEVILFQPAYDAYGPMVRRAGGVPVSVPLAPPGWAYDRAAIEAAITPRTRAIMLNDPLNPTGTVASEADLAMLAQLCVAHDLIAICDEVWEEVRFDQSSPLLFRGGAGDGVDPQHRAQEAPTPPPIFSPPPTPSSEEEGTLRHRSLLSFPGMAERAVKIGSAGKIFGLTGWKIGWLCAAPELASGLARAHQFLTFTTPPALQWAVAEGLALPDAWFAARTAGWAASRARLKAGLEAAGLVVLPNGATWFLCVDLAASGVALADRAFSEIAVREAGVASIPVSALFEGEGAPDHVVRFCFTKPDAMLDDACARLSGLVARLREA